MIFTSRHINISAPTAGRVKSGFFAGGEAAQEKLYTAEYVPSSAGEPGLFFTLLPLPHAGVEIPPSLPGMAHSATVCASRHHPTGDCKMSRRLTTWATSTSGSVRPDGFKMAGWLKINKKSFYAQAASNLPRREGHDT
jgi:hypothetical protein